MEIQCDMKIRRFTRLLLKAIGALVISIPIIGYGLFIIYPSVSVCQRSGSSPIAWADYAIFMWLTLLTTVVIYSGYYIYKGVFKVFGIETGTVPDGTDKQIRKSNYGLNCNRNDVLPGANDMRLLQSLKRVPLKHIINGVGIFISMAAIISSSFLYLPLLLLFYRSVGCLSDVGLSLLAVYIIIISYSGYSIYMCLCKDNFQTVIRDLIFLASIVAVLIIGCSVFSIQTKLGYNVRPSSGIIMVALGIISLTPKLFIPYMIISWLLLKCFVNRICNSISLRKNDDLLGGDKCE